ncbi:uncharacterized protein LOC114750934 isoform X2 [Neltuma alba]|uniref:uncharacterized protein LOC114750934 isoform X2 n=1 Tax=Neltuma alba TaxID=207710 RepID=UPI0010A4D141|nr:uncharacterized protein LOC114750934 isoform X2 [Prosopis alba]
MGGGEVLTAAALMACYGLSGEPVAPPAEGAKSADAAPLHTAAFWDLDECDFFHDDALVTEAGEPTPRLVFGKVPSLEEAEAATLELKNAIDGVYPSSESSVCEGSTGSEVPVQSPLLPGTETKSWLIEAISNPLMPKHLVRQACELLSTNQKALDIIASLASNPNVLGAIVQDPLVKNFLQSHQPAARIESEESPETLEKLHHSDQEDNKRIGFVASMKERMQNFMGAATGKVSNVSKYFTNRLFGSSEAENTSSGANGNTRANFMFGSSEAENTSSGANGNTGTKFKFGSKYFNNLFGSSEVEIILRLVMLVIMVVLFKRL